MNRQPQDLPGGVCGTLVKLTTQTCLVALDKTLFQCKRHNVSFAMRAIITGSIGERIVQAAREVSLTLPEDLRARI